MKRIAEIILPYQKTKEDESDLVPLKTRDISVNGYEITFFFTMERHHDCCIMTLQMYSKNQPFLPFRVICDCAVKFLGDKELGLSEFIVLGRKLYVWSVAVDQDGTPIPIPARPKIEARSYDGIDYMKAPATQVILLPS